MVSCCVLGCKNRSEHKNENITFHSFPKDPIMKSIWINVTGRQNWTPTKYIKMCCIHFDDNCFRRTGKLKIIQPGSTPKYFVHELSIELRRTSNIGTSSDISREEDISVASIADNRETNIPCNISQAAVNTTKETLNYMEEASISSRILKSQVGSESLEVAINNTLRKNKLALQLLRKSTLAEKRKKQIATLRSRNWRLAKKNVELVHVLMSKSLINQK